MDDKAESILNNIKTQKKKKHKNLDKIKQLERELVEINYSNKPDKLQNALKS